MQRNYSWLEIAEYLSIIASMIGSIAAVATQKVALMAAPMSMSLMLNLLHRRKLLHFSRQKIRGEVTKQCQEISDLVVSLKSSALEEFPTQEQLKQAIDALPLEQIETCLLRLCQKVEEQQVEITQMMANIENLSNDLPSNITILPQEIEMIKDRVDRLYGDQENLLYEEISSIKTKLSQVSEQLAQLHPDNENIVSKKKLKPMVSAIKILRQENIELRASITQLNEAVVNISAEGELRHNLSSKNLTVSKEARNQYEEQFNNCFEQISDLRGSLAEVTQSIAILEIQTKQIVPRSEIQSLMSDLVTIEWQKSIRLQPSTIGNFLSLDDFSPKTGDFKGVENGFSKSFDLDLIPQLHRELKNLSEEIFTLEAQMENRLAPLEAIDRHGFDQDLSLQAQAIAQLQEKTSQLLKSYEENDRETAEMSLKIDRLETLLDRLSIQVSELQ